MNYVLAESFGFVSPWHSYPLETTTVQPRSLQQGRPSSTTSNTILRHHTWITPFMERLRQVALLPNGWAGPGTVRPSIGTLWVAATRFAEIAQPRTKPPSIAARPDGGLTLTWYASGIELEIYIEPNGEVLASIYDLATNREEDELPLHSPAVSDAIKRLTTG